MNNRTNSMFFIDVPRLAVLSLAFITAAILVVALLPERASALVLHDPTPQVPTDIPGYLKTSLEQCDTSGKTPGYAVWIGSPDPNSKGTTQFSVASGTSSLVLRYYAGATICYDWNNVPDARFQFVNDPSSYQLAFQPDGAPSYSPVPFTHSGIQGDIIQFDYGSDYKNVGKYFPSGDPGGFEIAPSGGFTKSGNYRITLQSRGANHFDNGAYNCIGGAEQRISGYGEIDQCAQAITEFYIRVEVETSAPTCSLWLNPSSGTGNSSYPVTSRLYWTTNNAVSGSINPGVGSMSPIGSGNVRVTRASTTTFVATVTASDGKTGNCQTTLTVTPMTASPCSPTDPQYDPKAFPDGDTLETVVLTDASPNNNGGPPSASGASGYSTSANNSYTQHTRDGDTEVLDVIDISNGGARQNIPLVSERYQQAVVNYQPYVVHCPYDYNQAQVKYRSYYTDQQWVSSGTVSKRDCPDGGTLQSDGVTCKKTTSTTASAYCSSPYSGPYSDGSCRQYGRRTSSGACTTTGTGSSCLIKQTSASYSYSCSSPYTKVNNSTCEYTYSARNLYAWSKSGTAIPMSADSSADAREMPPCWYRNYQVSSVFLPTVSFSKDREDPDLSVSGNIKIDVNFSVPYTDKGDEEMRVASSVGQILYNVSSAIRRSGSTSLSSWQTHANTGIDITADSALKISTGSGNISSLSRNVSVERSTADLRPGDSICWQVTVSDTQGFIKTDGQKVNPSGSMTKSSCTPPVVNWPYLKVMGNDVVAGGSFGCGSPNPAIVRGYMRSGSGLVGIGSSAQQAVFATNTISGFTSVGLRQGQATPATHAPPPYGLTFSNSSVPYGGNYSANDGITCLPDYFATMPPAPTTEDFGTSSLISQMTPSPDNLRNTPNANPSIIEYARFSGNKAFDGSAGTIPNGFRKVIYIDGTLDINKNIEYENTSWTSREDIPYIMFIARDINIRSNVTRLDGVYVAQGDSTHTGTINTCSGPSTNAMFNGCRNELVVNGAFIASNVAFNRTRGTLRVSRQGEGRFGVNPGNAVTQCSVGNASNNGTAGGNTCAAEVISFSPETYMVLSQILQPEDNFKLDSYVNLPPNF